MLDAKNEINKITQKIIEDFINRAKNDQILKIGIDEVINNYNLDQKNFNSFPESYNFKNVINEPSNPIDICYFELNKALIQGYECLDEVIIANEHIKKIFTLQYFQNTQIYRCPACGEILKTSGKKQHIEYKLLRAQIDHLFPKSLYPQFALNPENFVPICEDCNRFEKGYRFLSNPKEFKTAIDQLNIDFKHPFYLYKVVPINFRHIIRPDIELIRLDKNSAAYKLIELYGIPNRFKIYTEQCLRLLFNHIKYSDIRSPESLERLVESLLLLVFDELNDDVSLNNSPRVWQEFLEWILYSETNLLALWEEVKDYSVQYSNFCNS